MSNKQCRPWWNSTFVASHLGLQSAQAGLTKYIQLSITYGRMFRQVKLWPNLQPLLIDYRSQWQDDNRISFQLWLASLIGSTSKQYFETMHKTGSRISLYENQSAYTIIWNSAQTLLLLQRRLTLTMLWANSADDKLMIIFLLFFLKNSIWHFMQIVS